MRPDQAHEGHVAVVSAAESRVPASRTSVVAFGTSTGPTAPLISCLPGRRTRAARPSGVPDGIRWRDVARVIGPLLDRARLAS